MFFCVDSKFLPGINPNIGLLHTVRDTDTQQINTNNANQSQKYAHITESPNV
jgi:hypothetical protein